MDVEGSKPEEQAIKSNKSWQQSNPTSKIQEREMKKHRKRLESHTRCNDKQREEHEEVTRHW